MYCTETLKYIKYHDTKVIQKKIVRFYGNDFLPFQLSVRHLRIRLKLLADAVFETLAPKGSISAMELLPPYIKILHDLCITVRILNSQSTTIVNSHYENSDSLQRHLVKFTSVLFEQYPVVKR